jgi:hypothetical protein
VNARCFLVVLLLLLARGAFANFSITATQNQLVVHFDSASTNRSLVELAPYQSVTDATRMAPLAPDARGRKLTLPRFDGDRDRLYSGFVALQSGVPDGPMRFAEVQTGISKYGDSYPRTRSKKGLQVQMVDDARALGVQHAGLNIDLGSSVKLTPGPQDLRSVMDGRDFWFDRRYIEAIDNEVRAMSSSGATVTLILLNYSHPGSPANSILQHPAYDPTCPGHISEFNTSAPEGLAWFKAWVEFLAGRYAAPGYPHGRVVNYIVGNEVNAHWDWANMGHVPMEQFAPDYERAVRICATAVRKYSSSARVYISLEHDWNKLYAEPNATEGFAGRPFVDYFNHLAKAGGDFDWNLAFHPYPEDLFNCRTWEDKTATLSENTPRITFKNIEMLPRYFRRKELLFRGEPRHIILSEQGFHAKPTPQGELEQAAAYCYAWRKIVNLNGIDAFILHRQVDNAHEGGLNLGLWRHKPDTDAEPFSKRPIYEVFRLADTPQWKRAFQFALPIIGIKSWNEIEMAGANAGHSQ